MKPSISRNALLVFTFGGIIAAPAAFAGTMLEPMMDPFHLERANGGKAADATVMVQIFDTADNFTGWGSGVLLDYSNIATPDGNEQGLWIATAAHVVDNASNVRVFFGSQYNPSSPETANGTALDVQSWYIPDIYDGNVVSASDIALIRLDTRVTDRSGLKIRTTNLDGVTNSISDIYGFGSFGTGASGNIFSDGAKRGRPQPLFQPRRTRQRDHVFRLRY